MDLSNITIKSERLLLEPMSEKYREDVFREFTEDVTQLMFAAPPDTIDTIDERIRINREELKKGTDLNVVVLNNITKEFLGRCALHETHTSRPELGIWIKKSAHGYGYGREAITALKSWADQHLDAEYYVYPVDKTNIASRKIAESLGGVIENEYKKISMSGRVLDEVEYHIPVSNT
jgi:RimJ/RimL family protein N-acetyltransferase